MHWTVLCLGPLCHYYVVYCCRIRVIRFCRWLFSESLTTIQISMKEKTSLWLHSVMRGVFFLCWPGVVRNEKVRISVRCWRSVKGSCARVGGCRCFLQLWGSHSPRSGPSLGSRRQLAIDWASRVSAQGHIPLLIEILFTYSSPTKRSEQQSTRANHIWQDGRWGLGAPGGSRPLHSWCTKLPSEGKSAEPLGCSLSAALCSASGIPRSELTACVWRGWGTRRIMGYRGWGGVFGLSAGYQGHNIWLQSVCSVKQHSHSLMYLFSSVGKLNMMSSAARAASGQGTNYLSELLHPAPTGSGYLQCDLLSCPCSSFDLFGQSEPFFWGHRLTRQEAANQNEPRRSSNFFFTFIKDWKTTIGLRQ